MSDCIPIFDLPEALNRSMGDAEFLKMMVDELDRTIPDYVQRIRSAFEANDITAMGNEAHTFKGAAANLGAKGVAAAALELERIGKSGEANGTRQALEQLDIAVNAFKNCLEQTDWSAVVSA